MVGRATWTTPSPVRGGQRPRHGPGGAPNGACCGDQGKYVVLPRSFHKPNARFRADGMHAGALHSARSRGRNGSLWRRSSVRLWKSTWMLMLSFLTQEPLVSSLPHSTLLGSRLKGAGFPVALDGHSEEARGRLAKHIIAEARSGERDQSRLRDGAVLRLAQSDWITAQLPQAGGDWRPSRDARPDHNNSAAAPGLNAIHRFKLRLDRVQCPDHSYEDAAISYQLFARSPFPPVPRTGT